VSTSTDLVKTSKRRLSPLSTYIALALALFVWGAKANIGFVQAQDFRSSLVIGPYSLSFGDVELGMSSDPQTITLLSTGPPAPRLDKIEISGPFQQTTNCPPPPATLNTNQTCGIEVSFHPKTPGAASGTVLIFHDGSSAPLKVTLSGMGTPDASSIQLSSRSLTFSEQTVGTTSPPQSVMLTSSGERTLAISSISVEGDFTIMPASTCESLIGSVKAHANCTVVVTFTPLGLGKRNGAIVFKDDAPDTPQRVTLTGTGKASQ